jgi:hypothetical protein
MLLNGCNNTLLITSPFPSEYKNDTGEMLPFPDPPVCLVLLHPRFQNSYASDIWSLDTIFFVKHLGGVKDRERRAGKEQEIKGR